MRGGVAVTGLGLRLIAVAAVSIGCSDGRPTQAAELNADGNYVLADLAHAFGRPVDHGRTLLGASCGPRARGLFARDETYRQGDDYDLVGRTVHALDRRGYHGTITGVVHSGEGTFGVADKGSGLHFEIAASTDYSARLAHYRLSGYLRCH